MSGLPTVRYTTNLIRTLRNEEQKFEQRRRLTAIFALGSFVFLVLASVYTFLNYWSMQTVLDVESQNLERLKAEFKNYTLSADIVDKNDVELLNGLQTAGIFWSKQLAVLGQYLPQGYWLKSIRYESSGLRVSGYSQTSSSQDEVVLLQEYLGKLEQDSLFSKHFPKVRLTHAERNQENGGGLNFEFLAAGKSKKSR